MTPDNVTSILQHLARLEEKQDATTDKLDEVYIQVKKTNGRVTDLEISRATERGAALQRAATIEDVRETRATDLAKNAWVKPAVVAVTVVALDAVIRHLT